MEPEKRSSEWSKTTPSRIAIIILIVVLWTFLGVFMATGGFGIFEGGI